MKHLALAGTILAVAGLTPLSAQNAFLGLAVNIGVPVGGFDSTNYSDGSREGYNTGLGAQFTVSVPMDRNLALRFNLSGITFTGNASPVGCFAGNTQDSMWSIGGEAQIFVGGGNAQRHLGSYLLGGLSLDLERFSYSQFNDPNWYPDAVTNKSRLGADIGFGHSFRYAGNSRWSLEAVFHKTLTDCNTNAWDPPPADFVKLSVGWVF